MWPLTQGQFLWGTKFRCGIYRVFRDAIPYYICKIQKMFLKPDLWQWKTDKTCFSLINLAALRFLRLTFITAPCIKPFHPLIVAKLLPYTLQNKAQHSLGRRRIKKGIDRDIWFSVGKSMMVQ